uniref:phosphopantetheine-binding protein n=1 Tax=Allorhizocola rhizosphaerae TaxID=1872709 RepID=UPI0024822AAC
LMEPMLADFRTVVESLSFHQPRIPMVSGGEVTDPEYWVEHVRRPVMFADAVSTMAGQGVDLFIEAGPDGVLSALLPDCLGDAAPPAVPMLRRDRPEPLTAVAAFAEAAVRVDDIDWSAFFPVQVRTRLPTYAFQGRRYWPERGLPGAPQRPASEPDAAPATEYASDDLREVVRRAAAAVLGYPAAEVGDTTALTELGLTSLTAVELRQRLRAATGVPVPAAALFDRASVQTLTDELRGGPRTDHPAGRAVVEAFRQECLAGRVGEGMKLLADVAAGRARTATAVAGELVPLAKGPARPMLVCLPSFVAPASPMQFGRLAASMRDVRSVSALPLPGYLPGEELAADVPALVTAMADRVPHGGEVLLVGYSSGGWLAHAVGAELIARGLPCAGVVLLDTVPPAAPELTALQDVLFRDMAGRAEVVELVDDIKLTAMGHYMRLFEGWRPGPSPVPTLLLCAERVLAGPAERTPWPAPHVAVTAKGDHRSLIEEHAAAAAQTIERWLTS